MIAFPWRSSVLSIHEDLIAFSQDEHRITLISGFDRLPYGIVTIGDEDRFRMSNTGADLICDHVRILISRIILGKDDAVGSLTVIKSKNIGKPLKYGFFFVKFLFLYVVCVVIMI